MLNKLYGIDYDMYFCGGKGNVKLLHAGKNTVIFDNESDMLNALAELKKHNTIDNISVFTTIINRVEYKI